MRKVNGFSKEVSPIPLALYLSWFSKVGLGLEDQNPERPRTFGSYGSGEAQW